MPRDRAAQEVGTLSPGRGRAADAVPERDRASRSSSIRRVTRLSETARTWPEPHAWLREELEASRRVFGPRIKERDAGDDAPEPTPP